MPSGGGSSRYGMPCRAFACSMIRRRTSSLTRPPSVLGGSSSVSGLEGHPATRCSSRLRSASHRRKATRCGQGRPAGGRTFREPRHTPSSASAAAAAPVRRPPAASGRRSVGQGPDASRPAATATTPWAPTSASTRSTAFWAGVSARSGTSASVPARPPTPRTTPAVPSLRSWLSLLRQSRTARFPTERRGRGTIPHVRDAAIHVDARLHVVGSAAVCAW